MRRGRAATAEPVGRVPASSLGIEGLTRLLAEAEPWTPGEKLYRVKLGERRGFVGTSGRLIVPPHALGEEIELYGFADGLIVLDTYGRHGILDLRTHEVIPPVFPEVDHGGFADGAWAVKHAGKWGYVDRAGQWLVAPKFAEARRFADGMGAVRRGDQWGFVDARGALVITPRFTSVGQFGEGLCACEEGGAWGFVDRGGAWVIAPRYEFAGEFAEGRGMVMVDRLCGFVDAAGREVIAPRYKWATPFREGLAKTEAPRAPTARRPPDAFYATQYGYIDAAGETVLELPAGDYPYIFTHGLAAVGRPSAPGAERRWGFVDRGGATVVAFEYDEACVFDDFGFAQVRTWEGWHVIDERGEYLARVVVDEHDMTARLFGRDGQLWP